MELRPHRFQDTRQSIAITPQVIQSIKLLKFGQDELQEFLREQEERNPLIEVIRNRSERPSGGLAADRPTQVASARSAVPSRVGAGGDDRPGLEETCGSSVTLREHLLRQVDIVLRQPAERLIAAEIVESLDPDGYLRRDLEEIADILEIPEAVVEGVLGKVQGFEPAGVAARSLGECLRLQLTEAGEHTPAMGVLLENLPLLANCEMDMLARLCGVNRHELADLVQVIRRLDPKPGLQFDVGPLLPALPDLKLDLREDGSFSLELNADLLPKVLVNREFYAEVRSLASGEEESRFVADCMKNANWLTQNLEKRARTILKIATEIVRQQKEFFLKGAGHIKPLSQRDIADAIGMHTSTVCRATSDKYIMTNRGMFELKFFFSNGIGNAEGEDVQSSEALRVRIKTMITEEPAKKPLSDDAIAGVLQQEGVDIARRTVAKYREMMHIPSSRVRRRQKQAIEVEQHLCSA